MFFFDVACQKLLKSVDVSRSYLKNKSGTFLRTTVYITAICLWHYTIHFYLTQCLASCSLHLRRLGFFTLLLSPWKFSARHIARTNCAETNIDMEKLRMKFSALNVDFDDPSLDFLGSRKPAHEGIKERYPRKSRDEMPGDRLTVCDQECYRLSRVLWALA